MKNVLLSIHEKRKKLGTVPPLPEKIAGELVGKYKLECVYFLSCLKSTSLSKAEVFKIIEKKEAIAGKNLDDQNRTQLYAVTLDWIQQSAGSSRRDITEQLIIDLHTLRFLTEKTQTNMLKYNYKVPYALTEYIEWLQQQSGDPVEIAVEASSRLLQSKLLETDAARTTFLLTNLLLLQAGYPLIYIAEDEIEGYLREVHLVAKGESTDGLVSILCNAIIRSLDISLKTAQRRSTLSSNSLIKIGALAKLTNESVPTVRHWTKMGLLQVVGNTPGGYQLYEPETTQVILKIRELQRSERKTVQEIRELLSKDF